MPEPRWGKPNKQFGNSLEKKLIMGMEENGRFFSSGREETEEESEFSGYSKLVGDEDEQTRNFVQAFFQAHMHIDILNEEKRDLEDLVVRAHDRADAIRGANRKELDKTFAFGMFAGVLLFLIIGIAVYWINT